MYICMVFYSRMLSHSASILHQEVIPFGTPDPAAFRSSSQSKGPQRSGRCRNVQHFHVSKCLETTTIEAEPATTIASPLHASAPFPPLSLRK